MIKPNQDNILIKTLKRKDRTDSGLFIPETANDNSTYGEVIAIGSGKPTESGMRFPNDIQVGDIVWFRKFDTIPVEYNNEELLFIKEASILGFERK